jgi:glucose/arabinose dehydrogenase
MPFARALTAPLVAAAALSASASASALALEQVGSYERPTYVTSDPGDADRLFVVEQDGRVQLTENGVTKPEPFLDIDQIVYSRLELDAGVAAGTEQGLLSIAFSPGYATNGLFYVAYSGLDDPDTAENESGDFHIDEFASDGDTADPTSRREVLTIEHRGSNRHYGGQLQFGPDGYLYASTGDGSFGGDELGNAQDTRTLLGRMLRIDPTGSSPGEYGVPADNPFTDTPGCADGCDEIWSFGLRNPWRFSFDRLTGTLAIGDVGQGRWEEVDFEPGPDPARGDNFGWDCREGMHDYAGPPDGPSTVCPSRVGTFTEPVFEYLSEDPNCSITGGYVVRDRALGDLYGRYLYADFCAGQLRSLNLGLPTATGDRSEGLSVDSVSSFGEDAACRIYVASANGPVYRLTESAAQAGCPDPIPNSPLPPLPPPPADDGLLAPADGGSPDTSVALAFDAKDKQKVKKLEVTVGCGAESCHAELGGKAVAKKKRGDGKRATATGQRGKRTFAIKPKLLSLAAGERKTHRVRFKQKKAAVRTLRKLLKRKTYRNRTKAKLEVIATDTAGNTAAAQASVKLRR